MRRFRLLTVHMRSIKIGCVGAQKPARPWPCWPYHVLRPWHTCTRVEVSLASRCYTWGISSGDYRQHSVDVTGMLAPPIRLLYSHNYTICTRRCHKTENGILREQQGRWVTPNWEQSRRQLLDILMNGRDMLVSLPTSVKVLTMHILVPSVHRIVAIFTRYGISRPSLAR